MARSDPHADKDTIIAFGKNIFTCCEIIGSSIDSLALRTDIDPVVLMDYKLGNRRLSEDHLDAIASEFRLTKLQLVRDYGPDQRRRKELEMLLRQAGHITNEGLIGEAAIRTTPMAAGDPVPEAVSVEVPAPSADSVEEAEAGDDADEEVVEETMEHHEVTFVIEKIVVTWDESDLIGRTGGGERFNLANKQMRSHIIGQIRSALATTDETLTAFNRRGNLNKDPSWWRNVETGVRRIYGTDVEAIAQALGVSPYALLIGADTSGSQREPVETSRSAATAPEPSEHIAPSESTETAEHQDAGAQEYFRSLLLSVNTEPGEGVKVGQLLELARDQAGVEWVSSYLNLTLAGQQLAASIEEVRAQVAGHDKPIRTLFLNALIKGCDD